MSFSERISSSLQESLLIGTVAGAGALVGADTMVAQALSTSGLLGSVPASLQRPLIMFAVVFLVDLGYNVFWGK